MKARIDTREEYEFVKSQGIEPMALPAYFEINVKLRRELEEELFGKGNKEENNIRFYRYAWKISEHYCRECLRPLENYSSCYISHRLSRGAYPEHAYDLRNFDILCVTCHSKWENPITRKSMRIYPKASEEMELLKQEHLKNKK